MTMKRTPRLRFRADPAIAAGSRVEELLRGLHAADGAGQAGPCPGETGPTEQAPGEGDPPADEP